MITSTLKRDRDEQGARSVEGGSENVRRYASKHVLAVAATVLLAISAFAFAATALGGGALAPFWKAGQNCGDSTKLSKNECGAAGETVRPSGIATDPETGHLYVGDEGNNRIDEFSAWGEFVKAWGWGVRDGSPEPQTCTVVTGCRSAAGSLGFGAKRALGAGNAGEFSGPSSVATDSEGDVYVIDRDNHRVQKFDREGHFLLTWGGGVISGGAAGTGNLSEGSTTVTGLTTTSKAFEIGQTIEGVGVPAGAIVRDLGVGTITLSKPVQAGGTASGVILTAPEGAGNVPTNERKTITVEGAPTGGSFTLTFPTGELAGTLTAGSDQLTDTHAGTELTIGSFHVGDRVVSQEGAIPAGTTITAIDTSTGSVTLSAEATENSTSRIAATETTGAILYDASSAEVGAKLEALAGIGAGNVAVGGPSGGPWSVEFKGSLLGDTNLEPGGTVARMSADAAGVTPAGTKVAVNTIQQGASAPEVCAVAKNCRAGIEGEGGEGRFAALRFGVIGVGPSNEVYVGEKERIQKFSSAGVYLGEVAFPGETVSKLVADPKTGDLYLAFSGKENVHEVGPTGETICTTEHVNEPSAIAEDAVGGFYAVDGSGTPSALQFDSGCKATGTSFGGGELKSPSGIATGSACYSAGEGVYVTDAGSGGLGSSIDAYGAVPDKTELCPQPHVAPTIASQYAVSVHTDSALLRAQINPHFWTDTTYFVQYGAHPCSEGGCVEQPAEPGAQLGAGVVNEVITTAGVFLAGLQPSTTYHYRFVSESGGGGPVYGEDRTFTTPTLPGQADTSCSNQVFRTGTSATLPDCRAYEMVSPVNKENGDILAPHTLAGPRARQDQSALSGDKLAYSSATAFGEVQAAPFSSQYIASRGATGWSSKSISPLREGNAFIKSAFGLDSGTFKTFSPELSVGWVKTDSEPVLGLGGLAGHPNLYRRDNATGAYQACTTAPPRLSEEETQLFQMQGVSADQHEAIFRIQNKLTDNASEEFEARGAPIYQLYVCSLGEDEVATVRLVSVLPDGTASTLENTAGGPTNEIEPADRGFTATLADAISADGSRVFWTASTGVDGTFPGTLYLRVNPSQLSSSIGAGKCVNLAKACTYQVSLGAQARFWTAAVDGSKALFSEGGDLYEFDTEKALQGEESQTLIAHKAFGVLGASKDLSRVYFLSEEATVQEQAEGAIAGKPDLYLYEAGAGGGEPTYTFIGTLSQADAFGSGGTSRGGPVNSEPIHHTALVSPDGTHLAFMSNSAGLAKVVADYDNTDQASGEADAEVYRYDAATKRLACVSCNSTGARPAGRDSGEPASLWAAALLPTWENSLYATHALSEDGKRIFFESWEALVPTDTNGKADVYEWEEANTGDCGESSPSFIKASGGCVSLISSGKSSSDSEFVDADPDGSNVFIRTAQSLLPQDQGLIDIYDAREGGGFAPAQESPGVCEGEACQGAPSPPNDATSASSVFSGPGDLVAVLSAPGKMLATPKKKTASQVKAEELSKALKLCRRQTKAKRLKHCEAAARKRYGAKAKNKAEKSNRGGRRS
jgi:hypothetical protein